VVDLVLQAAPQQPLALDAHRPAVGVKAFDDDARRALDGRAEAGDAQASLLLALGIAARLDDARVDERERRDAVLVDIDDDEPLRDADLRRGEADALRVVHRLEHVGNQQPQFLADLGDLLGLAPQHLGAELLDLEYCHDVGRSCIAPATGVGLRVQLACDAGAIDDEARIARLERDALFLDRDDLADHAAGGQHLVARLERGDHLAVPLLLAPLRHDQDEVEDRDDRDHRDEARDPCAAARL
jgi:hypothetical protein